MGVSTDAILAFGFDLGEELPEGLRNYKGEPDEDDEDGFEFCELIRHEAGIAGYPGEVETEEERKARWAACSAAENEYPVELIYHCSYDYPMYFLSVRGTQRTANRGYPTAVEMCAPVAQEKIDAMRAFCERYGIEWQEPRWFIFSMWG